MEQKIFMVDQLWMYILGNGKFTFLPALSGLHLTVRAELLITSFPQRWQQPKNDPLNVLEGIIEDTNAKTRPPIKSVYDLAMLITSRCCGMFDRHLPDKEEFQFLDMFESSIGRITNRETELFKSFDSASKKAAQWLEEHGVTRGGKRPAIAMNAAGSDSVTDARFQNDLLNIGTETELLTEIKDIRDEIQMIRSVLSSQLGILPGVAELIQCEIQGGPREKKTDEWWEVERRRDEQKKLLATSIADLRRMDEQVTLIYHSLTNLLDLKQKHANAFEARFAREQASLTARQGQTIMVFTIVTIVFLPMSFIAAFFAINIRDFPHAADGSSALTLGYVSKYMFGIGLAISLPLIALAFAVDDIGIHFRKWGLRFDEWKEERKRRKERAAEKKAAGDGLSELEEPVKEKPPRLSTASRPRGDTLDGPEPARKSYAHSRERGLSPLQRTTSGNTHVSWRQSHERRRPLRPSDDVV